MAGAGGWTTVERMTRAAATAPFPLACSRRPVLGPAAASCVLSVLAIAWVLLPPYLMFGAMISAAPFLGEQPSAAEQAQAAQLAMAAFALAAALPWGCWWLATTQGWRAVARFWVAAGGVSAAAVAVVGLLVAGASA